LIPNKIENSRTCSRTCDHGASMFVWYRREFSQTQRKHTTNTQPTDQKIVNEKSVRCITAFVHVHQRSAVRHREHRQIRPAPRCPHRACCDRAIERFAERNHVRQQGLPQRDILTNVACGCREKETYHNIDCKYRRIHTAADAGTRSNTYLWTQR
jgi:hypothetical protein